MSAYICNPEHLGLLAAYAATHDAALYEWRVRSKDDREDTAARVAEGLLLENIRSIEHRYPDTVGQDQGLPGPCLSRFDMLLACQAYARHYVEHFPRASGTERRFGPVDILELAHGYEYQSCETEDYHLTLAANQIRWINRAAIRSLPGHDEAPWSWTEHTELPAVAALYAKEGA